MTCDTNPSLARFLRPIAVIRAEPRPDREPEKRGKPPTPEPERTKPARIDLSQWAPEAVATWRALESMSDDLAGVISPKALIGIQENGRTAHGARPWWWCYGHMPVFVKGAVYDGGNEASHLVRGITEAEAQRRIVAQELAQISPDMLSAAAIRRHQRAGRGR